MRDEMRIVTLQQQIRRAEAQWDRAAPLHREYHDFQFRSHELTAQLKQLQDRQEALLTEVSAISRQQQEHKELIASQQKALRAKAIGTRMDSFPTRERIFYDATITDVQDQGVVVTHRDGKARIAVEDLSPEQIAAYGLDRGKAQIARNEEQQREFAFHSLVEDALQKNKSSMAAATPSVPRYSQTPVSYPTTQYSKPTLLRQTPQTTTYRVRNQGRARYYYVYPNCYNPYSTSTPTYHYHYNYPR